MTQPSFHQEDIHEGAYQTCKDRLRYMATEADDAEHFAAMACEFMRQIIMVNDDAVVMGLARAVSHDFPALKIFLTLILTHYLGLELDDPIR